MAYLKILNPKTNEFHFFEVVSETAEVLKVKNLDNDFTFDVPTELLDKLPSQFRIVPEIQ